MKDTECVRFLQWAMPKLRLRWPGFRRVRKQVCKRLARRLRELNLPELPAYAAYLDAHQEEWAVLDGLCHITISRFYRDRAVFDYLDGKILPALAESSLHRGVNILRCWSAGCASGEEAYTLLLLWEVHHASRAPAAEMRVVATDVDERVLERARKGCYSGGSLRELPPDLLAGGFERLARLYCVKQALRNKVLFQRQDLRAAMPAGPFDLILCRNAAFTYFDEALQQEVLQGFYERLPAGGILVLGRHEALPQGSRGWLAHPHHPGVYEKQGHGALQ
ncbi:MAG: chemotaxis protein CheR [Gammaproteobacteria bacterium]|nr:chemotaxis protein CheR [Gammaproteobacteria bacterium]